MATEKITCIVIDDEMPALRLMEQFILQSEELQLLEKFKSPVKAQEFLKANAVDIIFCDVQMPEMSGIDLAKTISKNSIVVFTTAFSEFAADAFDLDAADYIKKPFSFLRFNRAVQKARDYLRMKSSSPQEISQIQTVSNAESKNSISIKADGKLIKVFFEHILYVEGFQEYLKIFTVKERFITLERMKNVEALLPTDKFIRVHRSYIIAKNKVVSVSGNLLEIGEHQIPISRELKENVIKELF